MTDEDAATILLVEDDDATRTFLADNLTADGYDLLVADCVSEGMRLLERKFPDIALVDLGLPDASGYELLRRVRGADGVSSRVDPDTPLMVLSGRSTELDRVRGFDRGADDYVCKPFSYPELRGRVAALLRRSDRRPARGCLRAGELEVDPPSREVRLHGDRVVLSQKEFALLRTLVSEPTRVFTKADADYCISAREVGAAWRRRRRRAVGRRGSRPPSRRRAAGRPRPSARWSRSGRRSRR